jgi:hypothetical protein
MGWFNKRTQSAITNPVRGQLQVVACSPFPDVAGEVIHSPKCEIDGVITGERLVPSAVHFSGYGVPKPKWPRPGMVLPVTVDLADPKQFRIEWDQVPTGREAAEKLAERLRNEQVKAFSNESLPRTRSGINAGSHAEDAWKQKLEPDPSGDHAFPHIWREVKYAETSPALVNGLTPQQTELVLSGAAAALGLVPTSAKVLAAQEAGPSSAPGGTWDITVSVTDPNGGAGWEAVTRMSFSSPERRELRTAPGNELPVLVDPDRHNRIIVDVARLS